MKSVFIILSFVISSFATSIFVWHDGDGSDGASLSTAYQTIQAGVNALASAGDTLIICGNTSNRAYTVTDSIFITKVKTGASGNYTKILGADTLGAIYNGTGQVKVTCGVGIGGLVQLDSAQYLVIADILFDAANFAQTCFYTTSGSTDQLYNVTFRRCRFTSAVTHNLYIRTSAEHYRPVCFERCEIDNAGKWGVAGLVSRSNFDFVGCKIHNNDSGGVMVRTNNKVINNLIYRNGGYGVDVRGQQTNAQNGVIENNTVAFNGSDGIKIMGTTTQGSFYVRGNIARSNGGYGYNLSGSAIDRFALIGYNCSSNNARGHTDINGGVLPGFGNVTSDPLFTSETAGSEDFTLQAASPCRNANIGNVMFEE